MSAEQFSKLSLEEEMVTTRARAARARRSVSGSQQNVEDDQPLQSIETSSTTSSTPSLVISTNNLQYNVSALNKDLQRRVKKALEDGGFKMKYCTVSSDQATDGIKRFVIDDDITVTLGGSFLQPKCTCEANEKGVACKHIYWLLDQILSTSPISREDQPVQLSPDGATFPSVSSPVDILKSKGLDTVAGDLKWVVKKEELPSDDDDVHDIISNILSVFEPHDLLPGEFRNPESSLTSEWSKKYQDFGKLITEYAIRDPGFFIRLQDVVDLNFQHRTFFEKINRRIARAFQGLDEYIAHGTMGAGPGTLRFDVPSCAYQLTSMVDKIDDYCAEQNEDDIQSKDLASTIATALISILDRVVDRNVNAYAHITWGLEAPDDPAENNLFYALIASHVDGRPHFVLDTLRSLPQEDVVGKNWETLQVIEHKLADSGAPASYVNMFRRVVYESRKRAASETREGEAKRTMQDEE